jgi:hypothetical protein
MSDAVRYLALRADHLGGLADMSLCELGFVPTTKLSSPESSAAAAAAKALVTVAPTIPAIEAFAQMSGRGREQAPRVGARHAVSL